LAGPKSNGKYSEKRYSEEKNEDWSDIVKSQGTPGATRSGKRQGKILYCVLRKHNPVNTLILDFLLPEL
jgi:hypothetical protein